MHYAPVLRGLLTSPYMRVIVSTKMDPKLFKWLVKHEDMRPGAWRCAVVGGANQGGSSYPPHVWFRVDSEKEVVPWVEPHGPKEDGYAIQAPQRPIADLMAEQEKNGVAMETARVRSGDEPGCFESMLCMSDGPEDSEDEREDVRACDVRDEQGEDADVDDQPPRKRRRGPTKAHLEELLRASSEREDQLKAQLAKQEEEQQEQLAQLEQRLEQLQAQNKELRKVKPNVLLDRPSRKKLPV